MSLGFQFGLGIVLVGLLFVGIGVFIVCSRISFLLKARTTWRMVNELIIINDSEGDMYEPRIFATSTSKIVMRSYFYDACYCMC